MVWCLCACVRVLTGVCICSEASACVCGHVSLNIASVCKVFVFECVLCPLTHVCAYLLFN